MNYFLDTARQAGEDDGSGPLWGIESKDLDCTLLAWPEGKGVAEHTNNEIDVLMIVLEGRALLTIDGKERQLAERQLLLIPKGVSRQVQALYGRLVYLNVHKRRKALALGGIDTYRQIKKGTP